MLLFGTIVIQFHSPSDVFLIFSAAQSGAGVAGGHPGGAGGAGAGELRRVHNLE